MSPKFAPRVILFVLLFCVLAVLATPVPEFSNSTAVAEPTGSIELASSDDSADVDDYDGDDDDGDDEDEDDEDDGEGIEERSTSLMKRWTGTMTWFYPGLGNCGYHDTSSKLIVALPTAVYAKGKHCNKYIRIKANGRSVKARVRDSCPPCKGRSIDVSPAVFKKLVPKSKGGLGKGVQKVSWDFV